MPRTIKSAACPATVLPSAIGQGVWSAAPGFAGPDSSETGEVICSSARHYRGATKIGSWRQARRTN